MFRYEQLPTDQAYRDNFDDIFRKPEEEKKDKPVKVKGEDEDTGT